MSAHHSNWLLGLALAGGPGEPLPPTRRALAGVGRAAGEGRLLSRPTVPGRAAFAPGLHPLGLREGQRDGVVYVPKGLKAGVPAPLVVLLHGAGGDGRGILGMLREQADRHGMLLLAPDSLESTWDVIADDYGADVAHLDTALAEVFERQAIDPQHLAVAGFSDGASYALSLALINGDLFRAALAFAPGFVAPRLNHGSPRLFVAHGTQDRVSPLDRCSRRIVPRLRGSGYVLEYREFEGGHTVPRGLADDAVEWFLRR